jgi:hypothetical protein
MSSTLSYDECNDSDDMVILITWYVQDWCMCILHECIYMHICEYSILGLISLKDL